MLRLIIILILGTVLSACNLFESDPEDKSIPTLEGTNPDGDEITFISLNGYHAVSLNDQTWSHVNREIRLTKLSSSDTLKTVKLCERNQVGLAVGLIYEWKIEQLSRSIDENGSYQSYCYKEQEASSSSLITATLISQQENEGFKIISAKLSTNFGIGFDAKSGEFSVDESFDFNNKTFIAVAYNEEKDTAYIYRTNNFSFSDGDSISLDFYGEDSSRADIHITPNADYTYSRQYCEGNISPCIELSFTTNKLIMIKFPETLKENNGTYIEHWTSSLLIDEKPYTLSYRTSSNEEPNNHNPLTDYQSIIHSVEFHTENGLTVKPPLIAEFESSEWVGDTVHHYENFDIWSDIKDANQDGTIEVLAIDLSSLPSVPSLFDTSPSQMKSAKQHLDTYSYDNVTGKGRNIGLVIPIPTNYLQSN